MKQQITLLLSSTISTDENKETLTFEYPATAWYQGETFFISYTNEQAEHITMELNELMFCKTQSSIPVSHLTVLPGEETTCLHVTQYGVFNLDVIGIRIKRRMPNKFELNAEIEYHLTLNQRILSKHQLTIKTKEVLL